MPDHRQNQILTVAQTSYVTSAADKDTEHEIVRYPCGYVMVVDNRAIYEAGAQM